MKKVNSCVMAKENRIMIKELKFNTEELKRCIVELTNHYSKRLPLWATVVIAFLSSLSVGLIVKGVYG